ncbi:MAG: hypothetical protein ACOYJ1_08430 [Peptococcales bacterium]
MLIILLAHLIGLGGHEQYEPFGFMKIAFFPPIAWAIWFILFLYFLPYKKPWIYIYIFSAASYSVLFSNVLQNLGLFQWNMGRVIVPYITYLSWFIIATWIYMNYFVKEDLYEAKAAGLERRFFLSPKLSMKPKACKENRKALKKPLKIFKMKSDE